MHDELTSFLYHLARNDRRNGVAKIIDIFGISFDTFCQLSSVLALESWARAHIWNSDSDVSLLRKLHPNRLYMLSNGKPTGDHKQFTLGQVWALWDARYEYDWKSLVGEADQQGLICSVKDGQVVGLTSYA